MTKTICVVCCTKGDSSEMSRYGSGEFTNTWLAHPECKELDAKRGLVA